MSNWNLSDNVNEEFEFEIRGLRYTMRYPRTEELEQAQQLNADLSAAQDEKRTDDVKAISGKLEDFLYEFITPLGHETTIKAALAKENIKVMRNFNNMIKTEISL